MSLNNKDSQYNPTYFNGTNLMYTPQKSPKILSFKLFKFFDDKDNGIIIGLFQGNRGDNPELDFILKFLLKGKKNRIRTPEHIHWVVDLIMKHQKHPEAVTNFLEFYIDWYSNAKPFSSVKERDEYKLVTLDIINEKFSEIEHDGRMPISFLGALIELFTLNEKQSPRRNKMFENLLKKLLSYCQGEKDFYQILSACKAGYN